jgi:hypothetical protein
MGGKYEGTVRGWDKLSDDVNEWLEEEKRQKVELIKMYRGMAGNCHEEKGRRWE